MAEFNESEWRDAMVLILEKWQGFIENLVFTDEVSLEERIYAFSIPMSVRLRNSFPSLEDWPDPDLLKMITKAVQIYEHWRTSS
ncbi:MAG TPA: hypothetical protein VGG79_06475 [Roseiarcus sp.]|jgi:hypothetical protein